MVTHWAESLALFWLLLAIVPISAVDFQFHLIPDSMSLGGVVTGILLSFIPGGMTPFESLYGAILAGGGLFVLGFVASKIFKKEAMGLGDVKLMAGYGALMGVPFAGVTLVLAAFFGLLVMVPLRLWGARNTHSEFGSGEIPFGPFLALAAPVIYQWGHTLLSLYLGLFGIGV
jgi:leader peptidase (prepilin peptidase)/N-methyltransferase